MRKRFSFLAGMTGALLSLAFASAQAATPSSSDVTVPSTPGQTVTVTWSGTVPAMTNGTSDCSDLADTLLVDQHVANIVAPPDVYQSVDARFTFAIEWTPVASALTSDLILTVAGPLSASSDGGNPRESVGFTGGPGGAYKAIACGFSNTQPQPYTGRLTITTTDPQPTSPLWNLATHQACCEGNSAAAGDNTFVLAPTLVTANRIFKSSDGGREWKKVYPPVNVSFPFGIEGDLAAFGNDVVYFGTELGAAAIAFSRDAGETWTNVQSPVASPGNDQAWLFLGPLADVCPVQLAPYVLTGWFRIGTIAAFSCDGGATWPIQTPLVGVAGSGPSHVMCQNNARAARTVATDTRIPNPNFARMKGVRHGNWGTDKKFYWTQISGDDLYVCKTGNFGAEWDGVVHPLAAGSANPENPITASAFDQKGTLFITQSDKLYVSFDQGESIKFVHTLPRWGSGAADGAGQAIAVDNGTVHVALRDEGGQVWYLRGDGADTATPTWRQELVYPHSNNSRLDFIQIVVNAKGVPTIGFTAASGATATSSRDLEPVAVNDSASTPQQVPVTVNVLANDSDPDGDGIRVSAVGEATHGTVKINPDGTVTYSPENGFAGADNFRYTISDGLATARATVSVTVARGRKP